MASRTDYFGVQSKIIEEYTRTFVGRAYARKAFETFSENHRRGYFVVRGGPGQGKTAFSCHLVKEADVHHFIKGSAHQEQYKVSLVDSLINYLGKIISGRYLSV